jgi:pimeloyl-ACP methyl ester carboxylesterase
MQTKITTVDGLSIRYATNEWKFTENILLISPLPESILAFSQIWNSLTNRYNLLAIDLPGFGKSQGRPDLFSAKTMADFIITITHHFSFTNAHIVGPDIGTPIALFSAAEYPGKIKSIVVSSGACIYPLLVSGVLKQIIEAPDLTVFRQLPVKDIINGSLSDLRNFALPEAIRTDYFDCYEEGRLFDALQFLREFPTDLQLLDVFIDSIKVPVQIIWGDDDPIALVENAYILHKRLPKSELEIVATGHYVWEDHATDFADIIIAWIDGGYLEM